MQAYVSFVIKRILEGPLKIPKLKVCPILKMGVSNLVDGGFSKVLISPMAFIFAYYSHHLLVYSGFVGVILRSCIAPRSEVSMFELEPVEQMSS